MAANNSRKIFVNLAVRELKRSMEFFSSLGFEFNPKFTDDKAACMIVNDEAYVMLLTEPFFKTFTKKEICNANSHTEGLFALSCESRAEVDEMVKKASRGGRQARHGSPRSRVHVWLELLRPRRPPLGGSLDGPQGNFRAMREGGENVRIGSPNIH